MRLENPELLWEPTVAQYAEAAARGTEDVRALLVPLLPTLHAFLARRSVDLDEAEESLGDTVLLARSQARRPADSALPLLPWLLRMADRALRSRMGSDPVLELGLGIRTTPLPLRIRAGAQEAIQRMRREQRLALGMRLGDRLAAETIAAALGKPVPAVHSMLASALARLVESCFPGRELTQLDPQGLDEYISHLLDGKPAPEAAAPPELLTVLDALLHLPDPEPLTRGGEERVWRRYEEEQDEYLPGPSLPVAPGWLKPALAVVGLFLALAAVSGWLVARSPAPQEPRRIAPAPAATPRTDSLGAQPRPKPTEVRPQYTPGAERGVLGELLGKLYYVDARQGARLLYSDLSSPDALAVPHSVLTLPKGPLRYSVSPLNEQIIYSSGRGIWLQDPKAGLRRLLLLSRNADLPSGDDNFLEVRALAWHPQGHTLAFVDEPPYSRPGPQMLYTYTPGLDSTLGSPIAALPPGDQVSEMSWSPNGEYLLVNTGGGAMVVRPPAPGRPPAAPFRLANREAQWSPDPSTPRLLWTDKKWPGSNGSFGIADAQTRNSRTLGEATYAAWQPDGTQIVYTRFSNRSQAGATVWLLNLQTDESHRLSHMPEMQAPVADVEFAPDGIHLAYSSPRGVWIANYFTGQTAQLPGVNNQVTRLAWQPTSHGHAPPKLDEKGTILYVEEQLSGGPSNPGRMQQQLVALDLATGTRTDLHGGDSLRYTVSPFHTSVLIAVDNRLELLNLETREFTRLHQVRRGEVLSPAWLAPGAGVAYLENVFPSSGGLPQVHLVRQDLRTGQRSVLLRRPFRQAPVTVTPSPSGQWLLLSGRDGWSLLPVAGGTPRPLPTAISYEWRPGARSEQLLRTGRQDSVVDVRGRILARIPGGTGRARWANSDQVLTIVKGRGAVLYNLRTRKSTSAHPLPDEFKFAPLSPSGRWMLEVAPTSLWAQHLATGRHEWVASGEGGFREPVWIPNTLKPKPTIAAPPPVRQPARGRPVLFFTQTGERAAFQGLWMYKPGGEAEQVARVSGYDLSPDGGQVVYVDRMGLWMLDLGAGEERLVLPFEDGETDAYTKLSYPQWSPDGSLISLLVTPRTKNYASFSYLPLGVFLVNAESGKLRGHLVFGSEQGHAQSARWSAGGQSVLVSSAGHTTEYDLERRQIGVLPFGKTVDPRPSPLYNDRSVLYVERASGIGGRVHVRRDSGEVHTLSKQGHAPLWSPQDASVYLFEGKDLWWTSKDGTYRWLIARNLPGANTAVSPAWSPDGRLTYASGNTVWAVDTATGKAQKLLQWHRPVGNLSWGRLPHSDSP